MFRNFIFLILILTAISCNKNEKFIFNEKKIINIGKNLIDSTYNLNPDFVIIGFGLEKEIKKLKKKEINFEVFRGDFKKPFGDNKATAILKIHSINKSLGIRLRHNNINNKYYIIGWMTLKE